MVLSRLNCLTEKKREHALTKSKHCHEKGTHGPLKIADLLNSTMEQTILLRLDLRCRRNYTKKFEFDSQPI